MVIQRSMSPKAILNIWGETAVVFDAYQIQVDETPLEKILEKESLEAVLKELNEIVGSSAVTCIEGG